MSQFATRLLPRVARVDYLGGGLFGSMIYVAERWREPHGDETIYREGPLRLVFDDVS